MLGNFGPLEQVWGWLSSEWFSHLSDMDDLDRQKLYLLGLTRLLEVPSPVQELVLAKLQEFFDMWTNVIAELQDGVVNGTDTLIWREVEASEYDTPRTIAEHDWSLKDPIHTIHAFQFVKERLQSLIDRVGGESAFEEQWAVNVDKEVLGRFQAMARAVQQ